ncbi:MAG: hypothetical protein PWR29_1 [Methanolobus sp.]|jgi:CxxC-x17-CxxC domain-containing protein|nr:hypothetical protein [Methanolobus sp.]MDK2911044.1 hypothetical protein [Methanolobus sp.]
MILSIDLAEGPGYYLKHSFDRLMDRWDKIMNGRRSSGGFRPSGPREMHKAICGDCGQETEVPFVPDPDRPVYCGECYRKHKPSTPRKF